ncbi:MAG TPA: response regulator transcription factor [Nocardioidaceae bacterium]|nr:response regulator transcription factor [Nocardioidaceae bacterium]
MIRVVVADDQSMIRSALRALLESAADIEVVAEVADGVSALAAARAHRPDVVVMDIRMPGLDGLEATRLIRADLPHTAVIVLTTYDIDDYVFSAIRAGASGFLLKDGDADDLLRAVRACVAGEAVMSPGSLRRLLDEFASAPTADRTAATAVASLSDREREVLLLIAAGCNNEEIAADMFISATTVKSHVGALLGKLGVRDRTQAAVTAYRSGLLGGTPRA